MAEQQKSRRYGKCLVEREIGRGARATVFLAWHESLQIPVAVKLITKENAHEDEHFSERFMREARIAAQLSHSYIVRVYDCGETEFEYYLVMEYVEGESCKDKMEQWGAFDWQRAVQIIRQVAEGLQYASKRGIIHRDIKPENIMIGSDGDARVADLGLAKQVVTGRGSATADGDVLGTPYYMSPEQVRQPGEVDFRSDVYSLGATLFHMVSGEVPFEAPTPYEIMTKHLNEPVCSPAQVRPGLPEVLCELIVKAMSKDPADRQQSYEELIAGLDAVLTVRAPSAAREDLMGPVEESMQDATVGGRPAAAAGARKDGRPAERPIRPVELPVTTQNVMAKLLGVVGTVAYVFWMVCVSRLVLGASGVAAGAATMAGAVLLAAGCGYLTLRRSPLVGGAEKATGLDDEISSSLSRLCERLDLPTPSLRVSRWLNDASFCYSFFSRKATVYVPENWLRAGVLNKAERDALLAQALAGVYTGDSDLRTLLAVPVRLLALGGLVCARLAGMSRTMEPATQERVAAGLTVGGLLAVCSAIAALFAVWALSGVMALLFLGLLLIVAAFERRSRLAADTFAVRAVSSEAAVKSVIVAQGLAGLQARRLLEESQGRAVAEQWAGVVPGPAERAVLVEGVSAHYAEVEYGPRAVEVAGNVLSVMPLAADRLNRLAGIPRRRSHVIAVLQAARKVYAGLLGISEKRGTCAIDLAEVGPCALSGAIGGLLVVCAMALLSIGQRAEYGAFIGAMGVLGFALGFAVAVQAATMGTSPGKLSWCSVVAATGLCCAAMVGFSLFGGRELSRFAVHCPIGFLLVLVVAMASAAFYVRLAPRLRSDLGESLQRLGSRTAHTLIMSVEEQKGARAGAAARAGRAEAPAEAETAQTAR